MLILKNAKQNADGTFDLSWQVNEEQIGFLVTYAITDLVKKGLATVEEVEDSDERQEQLDFLTDVPVSSLGSA